MLAGKDELLALRIEEQVLMGYVVRISLGIITDPTQVITSPFSIVVL